MAAEIRTVFAANRIPISSRIMLLAQTLDVFWTSAGPQQALDVITARSGKWFDPDLVRAARLLGQCRKLFAGLSPKL